MEAVNIADTFGAMFIGTLVAMSIYGITTMQTYLYFVYYPKDDRTTKLLVGVIWILDTLHVALMSHAVHYYLIRGFGNTAILIDGIWSLYASLAVNILISFAVQCYFTQRIHRLTPQRYRWWVSGVVGFVVFAHLCFGMETVVFLFIKKKFSRLKEITFSCVLPFGTFAVLSDILVALALCILLYSSRTEYRDTNHLINKLIVYAINRCILTTVVAIVEIVVFSVTPKSFYSFAIDFVIGKLYANSLLAALNSRASMRSSAAAESHSTQVSTNFVATGAIMDHGQSLVHVRSRDSAPEGHQHAINIENDAESKQTKTASTMRKSRRSWS